MKKDKYQKIYYIFFVLYLLILGYAFFDNFTKGYTHSMMMTLVSGVLLFVLPLLFKVMKWKPIYEIYILWIIFITMASLLGSSYRFYDHVAYWDKYTHCFSGVLGSIAAYILFCMMKKCRRVKKEDVSVMMVFVFAINISIATLWELYEYAGLVFFNYDGIRHYATGVHDSMTDILVCIVGGIFVLLCIFHYYRTNKENFVINIYDKFYQRNIEKGAD